jgi:hypothetical protein
MAVVGSRAAVIAVVVERDEGADGLRIADAVGHAWMIPAAERRVIRQRSSVARATHPAGWHLTSRPAGRLLSSCDPEDELRRWRPSAACWSS